MFEDYDNIWYDVPKLRRLLQECENNCAEIENLIDSAIVQQCSALYIDSLVREGLDLMADRKSIICRIQELSRGTEK